MHILELTLKACENSGIGCEDFDETHVCSLDNVHQILTHLDVEDWQRDSTSSKLLWISGPEEHGKTVTAIFLSMLFDQLAEQNGDITVLYFFIDRQDKKDTAVDVLRSRLSRLMRPKDGSDDRIKHLIEEYDPQKDALSFTTSIEVR